MKTDILVYGGSLSAIRAALFLKEQGKNVVLFTHRTYLGEDVCDSLRLVLPQDLDLNDPLAERLYGEAFRSGSLLRPMQVKHTLDRVMIEADIPVMLGTMPGDVFADKSGRVRAVTLCNRSGRHWMECGAVIDGTLRAELARLAGVPISAPHGDIEVVRRVLGGEAERDRAWVHEGEVALDAQDKNNRHTLWAWRGNAVLADGSWSAWMAMEQEVRMRAFRCGQSFSADGVFALTGEVMEGGSSAMIGSLWVTGPVADVSQEARERLLRHDGAISRGVEIAEAVLSEGRPPHRMDAAVAADAQPLSCCSSGSLPSGIQALDLHCDAEVPDCAFAAVEEVDVLVVGGGTGGAPAGIAAAREGASTLVAEFLSGLGGVGTLGMIGRYWYGNRVGFTAEVDRGAAELTPRVMKDGDWDVEAKMQWLHREITDAGGRIWYKTIICGALREGDRVVGAILGTPQGRIAVRAKAVVDATGSAEVAAAAGAETVAVGQGHLAMQGTGLPGRDPGKNYTNTDYEFVDDSSQEDVNTAHMTAREKFKQAFDAGQLIDTRERRRVVGDVEVSPMDIRLARVFPDTVVKARSNFDTHGFTVHPLFMIVPPGHDPLEAYIPLRALLPKGLEGILVTGLGISAHRDAMPVIRMQADVQNQGYAAGMIAALVQDGCLREVDLPALQRRLVEQGILEPEIAESGDTFPLPGEEIDLALQNSVHDPDQIDRVFTLPEPERNARLQRAFSEAESEEARAFYAFVLGILGDGSGADVLAAHVANAPWDQGWNYTGMGQFGASMSLLDARIIALGRCRRKKDVTILTEKAESLPEDAAFSHYRALAEALREIGDPSGAAALEVLLTRPGITGHQLTDRSMRMHTATGDSNETSFRNASLIELHLAEAIYKLAPDSSAARCVLEAYRKDVRGLFARYAGAVLDGN
jgi:hypothetical protein